MILISPAEETGPESKIELGNYPGRIERFSLLLQRLLGARDLVLLNMLQSHAGCGIPVRPELSSETLVNLIAQCDLEPLDWTVKSLAQSYIPHVQPKGLSRVSCRDDFIALEPFRRHGTP